MTCPNPRCRHSCHYGWCFERMAAGVRRCRHCRHRFVANRSTSRCRCGRCGPTLEVRWTDFRGAR